MIVPIFLIVQSLVRQTKGILPPCEFLLTDPKGSFSSPNYPEKYPPQLSCVWVISAPENYYIEVTFEDFDIEPFDDCKTDVLEIKDGGNKNSPLIGILSKSIRNNGGQYCNTFKPPRVVTSTSNQLRLWLSTDSTIHHRGFTLKYIFLPEQDCGGVIESTHGEITSPRFPLHYPNKKSCEWKIRVPEGKYLYLKFISFEIETTCPIGLPCKCLDSVYIKDEKNKNTEVYCFNHPMPLVASSNEISIGFNSDLYGRLQGFKAIFTQSSTPRCGGDLFTNNGTIESPLYDPEAQTTYPSKLGCIWTIKASAQEYVVLHFLYFDVDESFWCLKDNVEIREGENEKAPLVGYYCNSNKPNKVISSNNGSIFIRFKSGENENILFKGFQIHYQVVKQGCGNPLLKDEKTSNTVTASSLFKIAHEPHFLEAKYAIVGKPYAWCTKEIFSKDNEEYIQIDFKELTEINKIVTEGYTMVGNYYFVTKFKMAYSMERNNFVRYVINEDENPGSSFTVFEGNKYFNVSKENTLSPSIVLKSLRIIPIEYVSGRRLHICMKVQVYGCDAIHLEDVLMKNDGYVKFNTSALKRTTWLIAPPVESLNSVYLFEALLNAECKSTNFFISTKSENSNLAYCDKKRIEYLLPGIRQLWVTLDVKVKPDSLQTISFSYQIEKLGSGGIIASSHGIINGNHQILNNFNATSIWLFKFEEGKRIVLDFSNIRLPQDGTKIVMKGGLKASSHIFREIFGSENRVAFVYTNYLMRMEYHLGRTNQTSTQILGGTLTEGFTLKYTITNDKSTKL
ncbi:cubilin isoform X3 [Hydra vulgaris]|uniref:Cubilin isoform X3 n=1 Tax=Hydra vulgaris TaxID=6087 RepID=A0ABM4C5Q3_HYDVU